MPLPPNISNCLILDSKNSLRYIPSHYQVYFINSKRRFFIYFRRYKQMIETMRVLNQHGVKFYRRQSLIPDRQQYEEQVFHCNYKHKKIDIRKRLSRQSIYNEPKILFEKYHEFRNKVQNNKNNQQSIIESIPQNVEQNQNKPAENKEIVQNKANKFKNIQVQQILSNYQLIAAILESYRDQDINN